MAILGGALLLPRFAQRLLWPLGALGSISLTAYLLHIVLVSDGWEWLVGSEPTIGVDAQLAVLVGLQAALVAVAAVVVRYWRTGPAERLLKSLSQPGSPGLAGHPGPRGPSARGSDRSGLGPARGQRDRDAGAPPGAVGDGNGPAEIGDQLADDGQPEPRSSGLPRP